MADNDQSEQARRLTKVRRRRLNERLRILRERTRLLELELSEYTRGYFRVCIFGSARIKPEDALYQLTYELGEACGEMGIDVLTGGGPGLMEAANKGVLAGKQKTGSRSKSFGLTIELNRFEQPSEHLDVKHHHRRFSSRLDDFMRLSNAVIVVPGGIGTVLELYFSWQLIQVGHITERPIVLVGRDFWSGLIDWMKDKQLGAKLVSPQDFDSVYMVDTAEEALDVVKREYEAFAAKMIETVEQEADQVKEETKKVEKEVEKVSKQTK